MNCPCAYLYIVTGIDVVDLVTGIWVEVVAIVEAVGKIHWSSWGGGCGLGKDSYLLPFFSY